MVESSKSSDYKQLVLLPPNPNTKRGFRVSWSAAPDESYFAYPCQNNVVLRNLRNMQESYVNADFQNKVTSVRYAPNSTFIASGDDKGRVKIWSFDKASGQFIVKKEHGMLTGAVQTIAWTDDGTRLSAGGEGKDVFAKAVIADSGNKIGDLFGPTKAVMTVDIRQKPYRLVMSGENYDIYVFDGVPFKHAKTLHTHTNFVNKVAFRNDGQQFVSVSSDKTIIVYDSESLETLKKIEKAHTKGIMDVRWLDDASVITCSTDNTVKIWNVEDGAEIKTLTISSDTTEKLDNQQLGLISESEQFLTVTLNNNINIWSGKDVFENDQTTPSFVIQGHANYIQCLKLVNGTLVSSDQDGKIFSWSKEQYAEIFKGEGHATSVTHLAAFNDLLISGSVDGMIKKSVKSYDNHVFEIQCSLKLGGFPLALTIGNDQVAYALTGNNHLTSIDIGVFSVLNDIELKGYEGTSVSYSAVSNEVWVGDKKGVIHILDGSDFSEKQVIEKKHNHPISYITTSRDGKLIASADTYRYIYVFDVETRQEVNCFAHHNSKVIHLDFNKDASLLLTGGMDNSVGIGYVNDKSIKPKKVVERPNQKELTCAIFDNEDRFFTAGYDCSIRLWGQ